MMEVAGFSEEPVHFYQTTGCHIHDTNLHVTSMTVICMQQYVCEALAVRNTSLLSINLFFYSTAGTSDIWVQ